eukprot:4736428-Karenia_brevis.AAC.1
MCIRDSEKRRSTTFHLKVAGANHDTHCHTESMSTCIHKIKTVCPPHQISQRMWLALWRQGLLADNITQFLHLADFKIHGYGVLPVIT